MKRVNQQTGEDISAQFERKPREQQAPAAQ
jgi:hypothetical protein